ncbi:MAG TPA: Ig-like domain-containing protein [Thermoguttaceae bacterium]|nr:Ig-like domain-containing protein [Thermoguttaceae bacterium]
MALKKSEKILITVSVVLVLAMAITFLLVSGQDSSLDQLRARRNKLLEEVEDKEKKAASREKVADLLADWRKRSLPVDLKMASALYQNWLSKLIVDQVGLDGHNVTPNANRTQPGIYTVLPFTVQGRGTLDQLTQLMYQFYSAGHLHKIRNMIVTPVPDTLQFDLKIDVEAMAVSGADRQDTLSTEPSQRLASSKLTLDDYRQAIVRRKMEKLPGSGEYRYKSSGGLFASFVPARLEVDDDRTSTDVDTPVTVDVLDNDSFEDTATVTEVTEGRYGTAEILADNRVRYTPEADFNGTDSFRYTVSSAGVTDSGTVTVRVGPEPEPDPPPVRPSFDATRYTFITAITEDKGGKLEAWLKVRTSGEEHVLQEGETVSIGHVECKILRIDWQEVEVELDGEHRRVKARQSLRGGELLPASAL